MTSSVQSFLHEDLVLVYIEWVDTIGDPHPGWKDEEGTEEFFERDDNIVRETGFIYSEDDDYLYLIGKYMPGQEITLTAHRTKVPKKWILTKQIKKYKPTKDFFKKNNEEENGNNNDDE